MLDPITLDQLRILTTVVDEGSFSAAARKLQRVQSAISTSMANLEDQLTIPLWDRSQRAATLTEAGKTVVASARRVLAEVDALRKLTTDMTLGLEASVSLCVDAVFPASALVEMCRGFQKAYPAVELRIDVQTMAAVAEQVLGGAATIGVASSVAQSPKLERIAISPIRMVPVVSARHPLAAKRGRIATSELADQIQIVLSERAEDALPDQGVLSSRTWRVRELSTKREMLRAGLGWGNLPLHLARGDIEKGRLVRIRPQAWADDEHTIHLAIIHRKDTPLGPAHRWMLETLDEVCAAATAG